MAKRVTKSSAASADDIEEIISELEDDEDDGESSTETEIEKKYDEGQARISIQRNDFLVPSLMQMFKDREMLDITPAYQRRSRWNDKRRSLLIESLLMNIPIPPIFLYERAYAQYEVMDGQQRLTAIRTFIENHFKLRGLKLWKELNGRQYHGLPPKIQKGLERRGISAVIILAESGKGEQASMELRQAVFERLNTGGERLNAQESRNCLYASPFNDMLIRIARSQKFTSVWEIPPKESGEPHQVSRKLEKHPMYSKMADVEIVLRYFTLGDVAAYKNGMKKSLDQCMVAHMDLPELACSALEREYLDVLSLAAEIYGPRLPKNGTGLAGRRSVPLADAVLLATSLHFSEAEALKANRKAIVLATEDKLRDETSRSILVGRGNTKKEVEARIGLMNEVFSGAIR
jgi:hypothetical protein